MTLFYAEGFPALGQLICHVDATTLVALIFILMHEKCYVSNCCIVVVLFLIGPLFYSHLMSISPIMFNANYCYEHK